MRIGNKYIFSNFNTGIIYSSVSFLLSGLCGIVSNLIIYIYFDLTILGIFNQALAIYVIISQISNFGLSHTILYFSSNITLSKQTRIDIIYGALIISIITAGLVTALCFYNFEIFIVLLNSNKLAEAIKYSSIGLIFFSMNKVLLSGLNGLGKIKNYAIFQAFRSIFILTFLIVLMMISIESHLLILTFCISEAALAILILIFYNISLNKPRIKNSLNFLKQIFNYAINSFLNPLLAEFYPKIDLLLLGYFYEDKIAGIYSLASILVEGINQIPIIFTTNLNPRFSKLYKKNKKSLLINLIKKVKINLLGIMSIIIINMFVFIYIITRYIINTPDAFQSFLIFVILCIGILFSSGYHPIQMIFNQNGIPRTYTLFYIILISTNVFISLIFISFFNFFGAAMGTAFTNIFSIAILKIMCRNKLSLKIS
tara:strand:- start:75 stop:1355 length:1281 start_codon:yes stop_codon:yes gene_type:complete